MKRQLVIDYDIIAEAVVCLMRAQHSAEQTYAENGEARWHAEATRLREVVDGFTLALRESHASWPPKGAF